MALFIILTVGGLTLIYNLFAEDFYISENKKTMNEMYQQISEMNVANLSNKNTTVLDGYSEQGFHIILTSKEEVVYSTYKRPEDEEAARKRVMNGMDNYVEDSVAEMNKYGSEIRIRGKIVKKDVEYYVLIYARVKTLRSTIAFMNKFLLIELVIILGISIPFSFYMANKTIKPVEEISKMTKNMEKNEYTEKDNYKFDNDEIGELAENIKDMYRQITNNVSEMNNYNYILKMQNKDLMKFEERRTEFINKATHELKTPLAIISSQLEMMNLDNAEIMGEYYDSIMEEIQKMSNLIRDMLKSSFDDRVMKSGELDKGNLSELIESLQGKYSVWLDTKHIHNKFDIESGVCINMNSEQIEQALNNYIINAFEHTKENGNVHISLKKIEEKAVISVYNEGNNIPEEEIEKIWNSFYSERTENNGANVGLGLYIVHDIVKYHGGTCYAKNMSDGVGFFMEFDLV